MIIRNRKTSKTYEISKEGYDMLVQRKISRNYEILDSSDIPKPKIIIPKVIEEYQKNPEIIRIHKQTK
jgi:hypothetical protein